MRRILLIQFPYIFEKLPAEGKRPLNLSAMLLGSKELNCYVPVANVN